MRLLRPTPRPPLAALIFDVDGTLAETERDGHRVAFNEAFAACGLDWHWDDATYARLLGVTGGMERMLAWWAGLQPQPPRPEAVAAMREALRPVHQEKTRRYADRVALGHVQLRPGIARLLREAHRVGMRLAIASTTVPANVETLLRLTIGPEAPGWIEQLSAGDMVPRKKPAPDIYLHALEHLGLEANQVLALEDSQLGLSAARSAGLRCIVTRALYTEGEDFSGAWAELDQLGEPGEPGRGHIDGRPWQGVVDVATLREWAFRPDW